ncbi:MAG: lactonase family protein, partial [Dehalococcoidia bacterium]|nr:lactonase family protein [Dehalococcoidia bacterium]
TDSLVIATNYSGGSIGVLPINDDGSLGELTDFIQHEGSSINTRRQEKAHAHSVNIDKSNAHAYVCDLGMDKVFVYDIDHANGKLTPSAQGSVDEVAGEGPRHFDFHPSGKYVYVINELGCTITLYNLGADGSLTPVQTVPSLPEGWEGDNTTADIHVSPDGDFVYGSNRGHDSLVIYGIDQATGKMTYIGHQSTLGNEPRNFAITPDGAFLLAENQNSDTIVTFKRESDGTLTATGSVIDVPAPVCIQFMPVGG